MAWWLDPLIIAAVVASAAAYDLVRRGALVQYCGLAAGHALGLLLLLNRRQERVRSKVRSRSPKKGKGQAAKLRAKHGTQIKVAQTPVKAAAQKATPPETIAGYAEKKSSAGLWQRRFFELQRGDIYLNYYKDYTKDSDTKGRGYVDLRHCGLVVAAKTVVILHLHDKSMYRLRFKTAAEASRWRATIYHVAKCLHVDSPADSGAAAAAAAALSASTSLASPPSASAAGRGGRHGHGPANDIDDEEDEDDDGGYWRFLAGCKGDEAAARKRWGEAMAWRAREKVDGILSEPMDKFRTIKPLYPHFIHRRARNGQLVYYEQPGLADVAAMGALVSAEEVVRWYVFLTEWMWTVLDPRPEAKIVSVYDMTRVSLTRLTRAQTNLLKRTMHVVGTYYPERNDRLFIVNAPWYFTGMWKILSPMVDPKTRGNISIHGAHDYQETLCAYVGAENVPLAYGGSDPTPLGEAPEEVQLRAFVDGCRGLDPGMQDGGRRQGGHR